MRPRRRLLLAAALLAAVALPGGAQAANHHVPQDNGTSFPEPEESAERGPQGNDPISWAQPVLILVFLAAVGGVLLYMRGASRRDRRR